MEDLLNIVAQKPLVESAEANPKGFTKVVKSWHG
jgi:hypothetical protein